MGSYSMSSISPFCSRASATIWLKSVVSIVFRYNRTFLDEFLSFALDKSYQIVSDEIVSDCWNDVDETEFACKEKDRIMMKLKPPGYENAIDTDRLIPKNRRGG